MKFKLGENGNSNLPNKFNVGNLTKNKKYVLIGVGVVVAFLLLIMMFSGGEEQPQVDGGRFENNESEQNNSIFAPPPPPVFEFDEKALEALEKGEIYEQNVSSYAIDENASDMRFSNSKDNPLFEFDDDAFIKIDKETDENLTQNKSASVQQEPSVQVEQNTTPQVQEPTKIPVEEIAPRVEPKVEPISPKIEKEVQPTPPAPPPPVQSMPPAPIAPVENGLSMSQRGISTEKIVETIDNIDNAQGACRCECNCCGYGNDNTKNTANSSVNNANRGRSGAYGNSSNRVEIRPDDMIIYLKAKQPLMRFDGNNLSFENKTYRERDIFKGWWKVEYVNPVYARFYDDLSGYAYNLRFLDNQGAMR